MPSFDVIQKWAKFNNWRHFNLSNTKLVPNEVNYTYKPYALEGPTVTRLVQDPLAVELLNNLLYLLAFKSRNLGQNLNLIFKVQLFGPRSISSSWWVALWSASYHLPDPLLPAHPARALDSAYSGRVSDMHPRHHNSIVKILNIYTMLSCIYLYYFFSLSIHSTQCFHCLLQLYMCNWILMK